MEKYGIYTNKAIPEKNYLVFKEEGLYAALSPRGLELHPKTKKSGIQYFRMIGFGETATPKIITLDSIVFKDNVLVAELSEDEYEAFKTKIRKEADLAYRERVKLYGTKSRKSNSKPEEFLIPEKSKKVRRIKQEDSEETPLDFTKLLPKLLEVGLENAEKSVLVEVQKNLATLGLIQYIKTVKPDVVR